MSEDVLIPKMKRLEKKQNKVKVPINNFILVILCTLLIIGATFIDIDIKHFIIPAGFSFGKHFEQQDFVYSFSIIPQIPMLMFVSSVLGKRLALTSTCLYIFVGLFVFPVFALGGGITYVTEYSFGFIIAFILGVGVAGTFFNKQYSFLNMLLGTVLGVLTIHAFGMLYMCLLALIKQEGILFIKTWIGAQSGLKIIYDVVLSFVCVLIGRYINAFLKYISD